VIDSSRRVQQLLVRVLFLPGISDSRKLNHHLPFGSANHLRIGSSHFTRTESSARRSPHLLDRQPLGRSSAKKMTTTSPWRPESQARLTRCPPFTATRVSFANESPSGENSLCEVSRRTARFNWSRRYVRLLFLAGITRGREVVAGSESAKAGSSEQVSRHDQTKTNLYRRCTASFWGNPGNSLILFGVPDGI
jgi:hypothetical protein